MNLFPILFSGGTNIGTAVATSINLTNSSEPMGEGSVAPHYKMEPSQEMYYQVRKNVIVDQKNSPHAAMLQS